MTGVSGASYKSELCDLLCRIRDPTSGRPGAVNKDDRIQTLETLRGEVVKVKKLWKLERKADKAALKH